VTTAHHVGYSGLPHLSSMQHHNELQTTVCGSIVLGHLLSMRVIKRVGRRRVNWHYRTGVTIISCYMLPLMFTKEMH